MPTLRQAVKRLRDRWLLPTSGTVSVRDLDQRFQPVPSGSMRLLLLKMKTLADAAVPVGGSTDPYYRRFKPAPQVESDFVRVISWKQVVKRLRDQQKLPSGETISVKELFQNFQPVPPSQPVPPRSMRLLRLKILAIAGLSSYIDLTNAHMNPYGVADPVNEANRLFGKRVAAAVHAAVGPQRGVRIYPNVKWIAIPLLGNAPFQVDDDTGGVSKILGDHLFSDIDLLEMKFYRDIAPTIYIPTTKCLAALAYLDYFPHSSLNDLPTTVSQAILAAQPGWCGTFGPGVDSATDVAELFGDLLEGNYDMSEMHLLQIAYGYYKELSHEAREWLITGLLAGGTIHRPRVDDTFTSGGTPSDWSRAGFVSPAGYHIRIGETENHILMILTARYLTNQLLYQRDHDPIHDNRRNGNDTILGQSVQTRPHCTELLLGLLRGILRDDFAEYNAKPYQHETRTALLNLCSYAYDHEVRLAARMVLDYLSAHIAVSSNDLRRMVPFRRRNEGPNVTQLTQIQAPDEGPGVMNVGLLEWQLGADPMTEHFAIQAGNTRAYENPYEDPQGADRPLAWSISSGGGDSTMEGLSDYRLPPLIHDLFVNDLNRRFFQRLHRFIRYDEIEGTDAVDGPVSEVGRLVTGSPVGGCGRNVDNMEIYASSPSYLITAGGAPATYAVDPGPVVDPVLAQVFPKGKRKNAQQLGVAVTTSFMPTGQSAGNDTQNYAKDLIQFSSFAQEGSVENYGVAPDFACGHRVHLPNWCKQAIADDLAQRPNDPFLYGKFEFVNKQGAHGRPGFYLAILRDGDFTAMEAFDTWLDPSMPSVTFEQFKSGVWERNRHLSESGLKNNVEAEYTTQNGTHLHFVIWNIVGALGLALYGAKITRIEYDAGGHLDSIGDAGNDTTKFLNGTILNSTGEAKVEITNHCPPFLGSKITLDMSDQWRPRRTSETGEVEEAGSNHEVWIDFGWTGPREGDFFHPFNSITAAAAAVANGGVIKIMPGWTTEKPSFQSNKRIRLVAPIGGVTFGVR